MLLPVLQLYLAKESAEKAAVPQVEEEVQKDEKIIWTTIGGKESDRLADM